MVQKRDGTLVDFVESKVIDAISSAAGAVGSVGCPSGEYALLVVEKLNSLGVGEVVLLEQIQDAVEDVLIEAGEVAVAKAYILYRAGRSQLRSEQSALVKTFEEIAFSDASASDIKRENANIDGNSAMGAMLKYGSESAKFFNHLYLLDKDVSEAHKSGDMHIHDLDFYSLTMTCCQIDLNKLFSGGFFTGHGSLREPNDIISYSALACIAVQANQNDMHGGQSIPALDYYMAPGVLKTFRKCVKDNLSKYIEVRYGISAEDIVRDVDKILGVYGNIDSIELSSKQKTRFNNIVNKYYSDGWDAVGFIFGRSLEETNKKTYQAMEAMIHNFNTMHSRAGAQTPFSSINYGTDVSPEGRMVIKNILLATKAGLGKGETPIQPNQGFKLKAGVNLNPEDKNYDLFKLMLTVTSKRLNPTFIFLDAPFNLQYYKEGDIESEVPYMGCRTRVIANVYDRGQEKVTGRGNLSFTTLNLPRVAIESGGNLDKFYSLLNYRLDLVVRQLDKRMELQGKKKVKNFPFLMAQGVWRGSENLSSDDAIGEVIKHGTLSIGFIGLAETLVTLVGKHHAECEESQKLGLKIVGFIRDYADRLSKERKLNYTVIATPAEGLAGRFTELDKKKFGVIDGVTDKDYYTNSFHVPVSYKITAYDKLRLEAPYHALTNAGHISYIELDGDPSKNLDAVEKVIRMMSSLGIGLGAINFPVDRDRCCGYSGIIDEICPGCGRQADDKVERIRRITGYLVGSLERFNDAKKSEEKDRVKHSRG